MNPVLAIIAPLSVGFFVPLLHLSKRKTVGPAIIGSALVCSLISLTVALSGWSGVSVTLGGWGPELGISLVVDRLSGIFLILAAVGVPISLACSMESFGFSPWRFYVLFFLNWGAVNGIILTGDLFNMFVFFEIFSVAAYLLVSYPPRSWQAMEASFKYLIFGTVGAMFLLMGIAYTFMATGQLNMAVLSQLIGSVPPVTLSVIGGCLVVGLFVKSGTAPTHFWLPDAHSSAHTPVSALLSGVLVKASVYALIRISSLLFFPVIGEVFSVILFFGTLSLILGHLMAFQQEDIKRLLAYSTVAQIGTILIGVGCGSALGISAAVYHSFNHMTAKMGLFLVAGVLAEDRASRDISHMRGLWAHRPLFVAAFALFAVSLAGIPPFSGFMSKWFLLLASTRDGHILPALAIVAGTVVSTAYYLKVLRAFFSPSETPVPHHRPRPVSGGLIALLSVLCVLLALVPLIPGARDVLFSIGESALDGEAYRTVVFGE
nr:proton-conducting transporter membrane subunit [uncultured Dethiosulfovibrio sp.]